MKIANFMRTVARLSLIFTVLNFVFAEISNTTASSLAFIWFCLITFICSILVNKNKKLLIPGVAAEFVPFMFVKSPLMFFMYAAVAAYCIFSVFKDSKEINYGDFYEEFKKSLIFFVLVLFLALADITVFNASPAFYIIVYLFASIMLLRLLRNMEFNKDNKYIMKQNIKYCTIFIGAAFLLSLDIVREYCLKFLGLICAALSYVVFGIAVALGAIFYVFYLGALYLLNWLAGKGGKKVVSPSQKNSNSDFTEVLKNIKAKPIFQNLIENKVFMDVLTIVLVAILILICIKLFRNKTSSSYDGGDFVEEKEYIKDEKTGNRRAGNIWSRLKPKNYAEQIRYNYYKFLKFCEKLKFNINKGDTTLDVNKKVCEMMNASMLDNFRNIYIKARYSDNHIDKTEAEMSSEYYRQLRQYAKK